MLALEQAGQAQSPAPNICRAISPLHPKAWEAGLSDYPDQRFAQFLLRGISNGFRIGAQGHFGYQPAKRNLQSAYEHPQVVTDYLAREERLGRILRLSPQEVLALPPIQVSPFGVIPKRHRPNKWRLIVDLSSPKGASINDAIDRNLCSLSYTSIDNAVSFIQTLGPGCLLAKLDLREAYRAVPVHPHDRPLLGLRWDGVTYLDGALPFGLCSAPKLFSALADGLMWILHSRGVVSALHYLDDFLLLGPPDSLACQAALATTLAACEDLGLPVAPEKTEGPSTVLTFLGIEIDTAANQLRLPQEKLRDLQSSIRKWMQSGGRPVPRRSGKKRELLSLIGLLNHAATVVRPGRGFLRSLIDASTTTPHLDHWVHLNALARADIAWWFTFLEYWNGVSLIPPVSPSFLLTSDASGSWGCGALSGNQWLQLSWPPEWADVPIAPKELVPIVLAVALLGPQWAGAKVCCRCDNSAVVWAVNKGSARDPKLMRLLRILCFFCAVYKISLSARHLPGVQNSSADALSRNNSRLFSALNPQASPHPLVVPNELHQLVFNRALIWTSPSWTELFKATLQRVSPPPLEQRTAPQGAAT